MNRDGDYLPLGALEVNRERLNIHKVLWVATRVRKVIVYALRARVVVILIIILVVNIDCFFIIIRIGDLKQLLLPPQRRFVLFQLRIQIDEWCRCLWLYRMLSCVKDLILAWYFVS